VSAVYNTFSVGLIYSFRIQETLRYTVSAFSNAHKSASHQTLAHQVHPMNNVMKKVLAVLIVAAVAAPAVSYAKTAHHHKYTPAKHVKHVAH
jgi:NADH:ubiquinone oxidoreductase subunit 5 (subunit L)/multisubunit Na+/H+ antiporter MnhA subunit